MSLDGWAPMRLGDVACVIHGFAFSGMTADCPPPNPIVIGIGNFDYSGGFRFSSTTVKRFAGEYPSEYELSPGDLLLAMTCQTSGGEILGIPGRVPDDGETYLHNQRLGRVKITEPERVDQGFLFQLARWTEFNRHLVVTASGSKILHTSPGRIEDFEFALPPLHEQRAIAATLGALDDKIESNDRIALLCARLVDTMARQLMDGAIDEVSIRDVVAFNRCAVRPGEPSEPIQYIDISCVSPGSINGTIQATWANAPSRARRGVSDGDVIFSTVRPSRRSFAHVLEPSANTVASTGFAVMTPKPEIGSSLLLAVAASSDFAEYLDSVAHGSAYPAVSVDAMGNYAIRLPEPEKVHRFEELTMPIRRRAAAAQSESRRLAAMRDELLPVLMRGTLSCPELGDSGGYA